LKLKDLAYAAEKGNIRVFVMGEDEVVERCWILGIKE